MGKYSPGQVTKILEGYESLDTDGRFSSLLKRISQCNRCAEDYPGRADKPVNCLVRPLPLARLRNSNPFYENAIRIKKDDTYLRNIFAAGGSYGSVLNKIASAKFAIGLNPWLDRCMLLRGSSKTNLMIIGIDYKHFPVFYRQESDHNFPLDDYESKNNIWGPTWKRFWANLLGKPYDDKKVNRFIGDHGVFATNSMLCFGRSENPGSHFYGYLNSCREHIAEMIRIVKPDILVSFGQYGCRNAVALMLEEDRDNSTLRDLARGVTPLRKMKAVAKRVDCRMGIEVKYNSRKVWFWPLYQPSRGHIYNYPGDYKTFRRLLSVQSSQSN